MTLTELVAKRTTDLMLTHNITQYRLIKETLLDKTTIQSILKNKTKDIKLSTVFLIASVFNMTLAEFLDVPYNKEEIDI